MSRRKKRRNGNRSDGGIDIMALIMSILFALIWTFVGEIMYRAFLGLMWRPLVIGLYFLGLALTEMVCIQLCGLFRGRAAQGQYIIKALCMILAVFAAAVGMDYIYEQLSFKSVKPTSFIFVLDDSSSMYSVDGISDPQNKRVDAVIEVMNSCDANFPFAVYSYSDECKLEVPMMAASQVNSIDFGFLNQGSTTYTFHALDMVIDDMENGNLQGVGSNPRIILLTDGKAHDDSLDSQVITRAAEKNISICTVGFGSYSDTELKKIAGGTNGVSVHIDNVTNLPAAVMEAANAVTSNHNLLNYREKLEHDWAYFLIRMVFVLILGCMFLYIKAQLLRTNVTEMNVLPVYIALLLVGGLCLEIGINVLNFNEISMHGMMCVLFLLNVTGHKNVTHVQSYDDDDDTGYIGRGSYDYEPDYDDPFA